LPLFKGHTFLNLQTPYFVVILWYIVWFHWWVQTMQHSMEIVLWYIRVKINLFVLYDDNIWQAIIWYCKLYDDSICQFLNFAPYLMAFYLTDKTSCFDICWPSTNWSCLWFHTKKHSMKVILGWISLKIFLSVSSNEVTIYFTYYALMHMIISFVKLLNC